jgi:hypothetical protein
MLNSPVTDAEIPVNATACSLCKVNTLAALVAPTFVVANFAVTGVSLACAVPVPDNDTVCGLLGELSVNVKAPVRAPICVGVNVTSITQLLPAANVLPQGFVLAT